MMTFFQNALTMPIHQGKWLKEKLKNSRIKQEDFAGILGVSRNTLHIIMQGSELNPKYKSTILKELDSTEDDLDIPADVAENAALYNPDRTPFNVINQVSRSNPNMWLVPIRAQAGFAKRFHDPVFQSQMQRVAFPMVMGECWGFEVEGQSMEPRYTPFSWVVCKLIDDSSWLAKGRSYVFQTYEGIYIKQFDRIENDVVYMMSINPDFNPVEPLPLDDVRRLYSIEGRFQPGE